jgi:hypothetical protein
MEISSVSQHDYGMESQNLSAFAQAIKNKQNKVTITGFQQIKLSAPADGTFTVREGTEYERVTLLGLNTFVKSNYLNKDGDFHPNAPELDYYYFTEKDTDETPAGTFLDISDKDALSKLQYIQSKVVIPHKTSYILALPSNTE